MIARASRYVRFFIGLVLAGVLAAVASIAVSDSEPLRSAPSGATAEAKPVLRMGYTEFPPYSVTRRDGVAEGFSIDVMRLLAERAGYELVLVPARNPSGALELLTAGEIDATSLFGVTPERQQVASFTSTIWNFETSIFVRADEDRYTRPEELVGARVGVTAGSSTAQVLRNRLPLLEPVVMPQMSSTFVALLSGEVDAVTQARDPFMRMVHKAGMDRRVRELGKPLSRLSAGFMVPNDRPELRADLNLAIAQVVANGSITRLAERWFGQTYSIWRDPKIAWLITGTALILALTILVLINRTRARASAAAQAQERILSSALDGVDIVFVLFDQKMRVVRWNREMERRFPSLVPLLKRRVTMHELIAATYRSGAVTHAMNDNEIEVFADAATDRLRSGLVREAIEITSDGRVLGAKDYAIPGGWYVATRVDLTRVKRSEAALQTFNQRLTQANEELERFANIAAHDLRAPLRALMTLPKWVGEDLADAGVQIDAGVQQHLTAMTVQAKRMDALLADLLEYARLGGAELAVSEIDPQTRITDILSLLAVPEQFRVDIEGSLPSVRLNPTAFDTVFRNLISNAIKHHDQASGCVSVRGWRERSTVFFEVEDDGPGIAPQHREKVFEIFSTLKPRDSVEGSGMGLAFIHKIVSRWGGRIEIDDPESGRGCIFRLVLPDAAAEKVALAA